LLGIAHPRHRGSVSPVRQCGGLPFRDRYERTKVATVVAVRVTVGWLIHRELEAAGLAAGSQESNRRARYWSPTTPSAPRCSCWSRGRVPLGALLSELLAADSHAPIH
jgi:hypothetical protein